MNPAKITATFIQHHKRPAPERAWLKSVFSIMIRVARRNSEFCMDDIWSEIDKSYANGTITDVDIDHRILGPMLLHMCREGMIASSQYYIKSTRPGGGSRPITLWTSLIHQKARSAA